MSTPFANELRRLREARGLTYRQVADAIGSPMSTITSLEAGLNTPRAITLFRLAAVYGVPIEHFREFLDPGFYPDIAPRPAMGRPKRQ